MNNIEAQRCLPFRSVSRISGSCSARPFATACITALACPDVPPPRLIAKILYAPRTPAILKGRRTRSRSAACTNVSRNGRPFTNTSVVGSSWLIDSGASRPASLSASEASSALSFGIIQTRAELALTLWRPLPVLGSGLWFCGVASERSNLVIIRRARLVKVDTVVVGLEILALAAFLSDS